MFPVPLFDLQFLFGLAATTQELQTGGTSRAETVHPRAPYIAACCDRQYRPQARNWAARVFPWEPSWESLARPTPRDLPASELTGLGQLDLDPQLDLGQYRIQAGVARGRLEVGSGVTQPADRGSIETAG